MVRPATRRVHQGWLGRLEDAEVFAKGVKRRATLGTGYRKAGVDHAMRVWSTHRLVCCGHTAARRPAETVTTG